MDEALSHATLGGGCFWCLEAVFERVRGVSGLISGYAGGRRPNPSYAQVSTGVTGHAEVIRFAFEPGVISYSELLELFFVFHDPTTRDRQGPDQGSQYRSIILAEDAAQFEAAERVIAQLDAAGVYPDPIVTELVRLERFWPGEVEHQSYYRRHPEQAYCRAIIAPKVAKLRRAYASRLTA
jgi:peptide-methionine (S)-S-oxide reductase